MYVEAEQKKGSGTTQTCLVFHSATTIPPFTINIALYFCSAKRWMSLEMGKGNSHSEKNFFLADNKYLWKHWDWFESS